MLSTFANILTSPLIHFSTLVIISGLLLLVKKKNYSFYTILFALILLFSCSQSFLSSALLHPLEHHSVNSKHAKNNKNTSDGQQVILVMACNYYDEMSVPYANRWPPCSYLRLSHAADIYQTREAKIIVAGGKFGDWPSAYSRYAREFLERHNVKSEDIIEVPIGYDTESEIQGIVKNITLSSLTLVTSASHMLRASSYLKFCGVSINAAPTDFLVKPKIVLKLNLPDPKNLTIIKRALHEYFGLVEFKLKRRFGLLSKYC